MITLLWYLVIAALIAGVIFAVTLVVFGRGEQMTPLAPRTSPSQLPEAGLVAGSDVQSLRLGVALRGYRMSDVDWTLDRLAEELDLARADRDRLRELVIAHGGDPEPVVLPAEPSPEELSATEASPEELSATESSVEEDQLPEEASSVGAADSVEPLVESEQS